MPDKYVEKQLKFYEAAKSEEAQDNALYRIGTHLELESVPCNGNATLTDVQRTTILDAAKCKGDNNE